MSARRPWSRRPTRCAARSRRPSSSPSAATPCSRASSRSGSARGSASTSTRARSSSSRSCRRPRRARPTGGRSAGGRADARESLPDDHRRGARRAARAGRRGDPAPRARRRGRGWQRDAARELGKYRTFEPHRYAPGEIERIRRAYADEAIRGATPRHWEDVEVGELLPTVVKGPLTVTSVIAFVQGWGSLYVRAHGLAFDLFERHPALGIENEFGVPEPPERVHWDEDLARAVGVPAPYDYGPERVAWLGHLVTNWMGDAGGHPSS